MIKTINKTQEVKAKLSNENKVSYLDKPEHIEAIINMNTGMDEIEREYKIKETNSETSASEIVLMA